MTYKILYNGDFLSANSQEEAKAYIQVLKDLDVSYEVEESFLVALVRFQNDSRVYTYFTDKVLPDNSYAVVETSEWKAGKEATCYKIVNVVRCTMRTKAELESICPLNRYKSIIGTVNWF